MGHLGVVPKVFAEVFEALLGIEELLDTPDAESTGAGGLSNFLLELGDIATFTFWSLLHANNTIMKFRVYHR